jgi:hypothetical protein
MNDDTILDVNQADAQTADISSDVQQTAESVAPQSETESATPTDLKTVPYDRFAEKVHESNRKIEELEQKIAQFEQRSIKDNAPKGDPMVEQAKTQLKELLKEVAPELGFVSKDELVREKRDQALEADLKRLEKEWDGSKDPSLKFDRQEVIDYALQNGIGSPEAAFKLLKEKEWLNYHIRQASSKTTGVKTEGSDGSGSSNTTGTSDDDLKEAIANGDKNARMTRWKRQFANLKNSK